MKPSERSVIKYASIGGILSCLIIFGGTWLLGNIGQAEAVSNIEEIRPTLRFTASGGMTATSTVLALMLTLLSFSKQSENTMNAYHYERIHWIARVSAFTFIGALILLMLLNLPLRNAEESLNDLYTTVYYVLIAYVGLLGGALTMIVLLLYNAVTDIITLAHPERDSDYLLAKEKESKEK